MAKAQNKSLFIDTYASYCQPCKILAKEFTNPELAAYYNANFLNVRVNMEKERAKAYNLKYQIVFLPTLIFAGPEGHLRMKIDHLVSAKDLLKFGKILNGERPAALAQTTSTPSTIPAPTHNKPTRTSPETPKPKTSSVTPSTIPVDDSEGKILYVMGQDSDNLPPEILREEAYFRMQLMDGSHHETAAKYLSSQKDWNTPENIVFVHDFLHDARSTEFQFLIDHREAFNNIVGAERVAQTINILVNKELERGYPRPDLDRTITLLEYAQREDPTKQGMIYHLRNLFAEKKVSAFLKLGHSIDMAELEDADLLYKYSSEKAARTNSSKELKACYQLAKEAAQLSPAIAIYHYNQAQIALLLKDKKAAKKAAMKALDLVDNNEDASAKIKQLLVYYFF